MSVVRAHERRRLTNEDRATIHARSAFGASAQTIATELGIGVSTVYEVRRTPLAASHRQTGVVRTGWVCPKCNDVLAPWMPYCDACRRMAAQMSRLAPEARADCFDVTSIENAGLVQLAFDEHLISSRTEERTFVLLTRREARALAARLGEASEET